MIVNPFTRAAAAVSLLVVPVVIELLQPDLADTVTGHVVFGGAQMCGWALLWTVARQLPTVSSRAGRFGRRASLVGIGCQAAFGAVYGATSFDAEPLEASFVLFLVGFLALAVGGVTWGLALRRGGGGGVAGTGLLAVSLLGLLAVTVAVDPWHDVFLLASYAAWLLVARRPALVSERSLTYSRRL